MKILFISIVVGLLVAVILTIIWSLLGSLLGGEDGFQMVATFLIFAEIAACASYVKQHNNSKNDSSDTKD